jgi:hypothetical protein
MPLDKVLYLISIDLDLNMRNRIISHFEHGLHCSRTFSGRCEQVSKLEKGAHKGMQASDGRHHPISCDESETRIFLPTGSRVRPHRKL